MDEKIHLVCTIDENYMQHCCVMLASLFTNNKEHCFYVHIIVNKPDYGDFEELGNFIKSKQHVFRFYSVNEQILSSAPISHHVSLATYYRILMPELLDNTIHKVLFLDSDLLVRHSVRDFWNIDIQSYALAAVKENSTVEYKRNLSIPDSYGYFNAGVLLVNLDFWRKNEIPRKLIEYIAQNSSKLISWDQDALNAVLYNSCLYLSPVWNVTNSYFVINNPSDFDISVTDLAAARNSPAIVHFTGSRKPWQYGNRHPYRKEYFYYLKLTSQAIQNMQRNLWRKEINMRLSDYLNRGKFISAFSFYIRSLIDRIKTNASIISLR